MNPTPMVKFSAAVEGKMDEALIRRLIEYIGAETFAVYGKKGKGFIRKYIDNFNHSGKTFPWIILVDLDEDFPCAPGLVKSWIQSPTPFATLRVAVREMEAWLLADRERVASYYAVPLKKIPENPENLTDPKQALLELFSLSKKKVFRENLISPKSGKYWTGPTFTLGVIQFILDKEKGWRPQEAAKFSEGLFRTINKLKRLQEDWVQFQK